MIDADQYAQGWTVGEAIKRVPNALTHLHAGNLLAWGKVGTPEIDASYIPAVHLTDGSLLTAKKASVSTVLRDGRPIFDLRIFPVLESPNPAEYLGQVPLKSVFNRFVVGDPEVQHLAERAMVDLPELRTLYREIHRSNYWLWPLDIADLIDIGEMDPLQDYFTKYVSTPKTELAQRVLRKRYSALINVLRSGVLAAFGDPVRSTDPQEILPTIWGAPGYYLDRRTGDLLQDRDWGDEPVEVTHTLDGREDYQLRWRAALLRPSAVSPGPAIKTEELPSKGRIRERYDRCFAYLFKIMKDSSSRKPKAKRLIFQDAKAVCGPNLGWPVFTRAWDAAKSAVPEAAEAWSQAGAPKKS